MLAVMQNNLKMKWPEFPAFRSMVVAGDLIDWQRQASWAPNWIVTAQVWANLG